MPPSKDLPAVQLVGHANFVRHNPKSDKFDVRKFDHIEFYCGDATNASRRFAFGLGLALVGKADQSTGNHASASYVARSGDVTLVFTAPYALETAKAPGADSPLPGFDAAAAFDFTKRHGLAVRALGIRVGDAADAYAVSVANGAEGVLSPTTLTDAATGTTTVLAEVKLYGDVVLRYVSGDYAGVFVPGYAPLELEGGAAEEEEGLGIERIDHCVGNVPKLAEAVAYVMKFTGFHEFAEFTAEDVGTLDSGLNSMVLASNNELVLLPINEPTFGTKRKSQIQTYLEQNVGAGLQHMALKTRDIFKTLAEMRRRSRYGGFEFMPAPNDAYYKQMPARIGDVFSAEQYKQIQQLGLLVDKDDQGILLQIFTKPLGDRATVFFEIIERVGCMTESLAGRLEQAAGCGGFGKGNFSALFKSIEDYEKTLNV